MNHSVGLEAKLSQQLHLSPQLQQSLQVLQAPLQELQQLVRQEVEANPILELEMPEVSLEDERTEERLQDDFDEEFSRLSQMDEEWRNYLSQSASANRTPRSSEDEERRQFLFDSMTTPVTLQDHLLQQLQMVECNETQKDLTTQLIGNLDDNGFLSLDLEEMALQQSLPIKDLEEALEILQGFDPCGIGARNLQECLALQLKRAGREHSLEARIISGYFQDLAMHRFHGIAKKLGVPTEAVSKAVESIGSLNPRPAANFSSGNTQYVQADVTVESAETGYTITLNEENLPRLRISNLYKDIMTQGAEADVREYIKTKIQSGKFFIRSIQQRQETIRKIAQEIVKRQEEFFQHGVSHLRPMTMGQVAEVVGVHETTVSRAVNGKFMASPQGLHEMRFFFTTGYETESGASLSKNSVKETLREIVEGESASHPLNDDEIMKELIVRGMKIARRTVAKYRDELGILPVNLRRKI